YLEAVRKELFFLDWAPVIFASAKTGENVLKLFQQVAVVEEEMNRRVDTPELNRLLGQATQSYPPPLVGGRRFKIYYAFQKPVAPPVFVLFVNDESCLTPHYERFLMDRIRQRWGFCGCPLRFQLRARTSKETPGKTRC
ncbi:MAG: hypothetical protein N3B01_10720, partial [Verrucomicrobiae bacterium]|nr:hypothetical protein [Verrucomicrobiae bacterium]